MIVNGYVTMSITINVIGLETDAVELNKYGEAVITDPDQFFVEWVDEFSVGNGELLGASSDSGKLEVEDEADEIPF